MTKDHSFYSFIRDNYWISFIGILLVAIIIRFYQLGTVPHGMAWDEAAIGYNGYAIVTTLRDEWLKPLPLSFQSFGDYKSPLAIYLNGPFTLIFGMTLFAVRLPFAVASILAIAGFMLLVRLLTQEMNPRRASQLSLLSGILMTFSPWHIHYSRVAFESGLSTSFLIWGVLFFFTSLFYLDQKKKMAKWFENPVVWMSLSIFTFAAAVYSYHSAKVVVPLLGGVLLAVTWKRLWSHRSVITSAVVSGVVAFTPFLIDVILGKGNARLGQASILSTHPSFTEAMNLFIQHYLRHLTPQFLLFGETITLRHGDGKWGVFLPTTLAVIVSGSVMTIWRWLRQKETAAKRAEISLFIIGLSWAAIGLIPAALGVDIPHSNRALLALPGFLLMAITGIYAIAQTLSFMPLNKQVSGTKSEHNLLVKSVFGTFFLIHLLFSLAYLKNYFTVYAADSTSDFKDGYLEAAKIAREYEDHVDKVVFTTSYGQPYIYLVFYRRVSPFVYQGGALIKYEYNSKITEADLQRKNVLIIATPQEIDPSHADRLVIGSDGSVRFVIVKTP